MRSLLVLFSVLSLAGFSQPVKKDSISRIKVKKEKTEEIPVIENSTIVTIFEEMPQYPGGYVAMQQCIIDNTKMPIDYLTGTIYASFTVDEKGNVRDIKIIKGLSPACDKAAVDAISKLKQFSPAMQRGKAVSCPFNISVRFSNK